MIKFLDLVAQYQTLKPEMDAAIFRVLQEGSFVGGTHVKNFEEQFSSLIGVAHCIGVANGTDAIEIAIEALDLPAGSEVIVPANSFIASSEAVTRQGHRVVFADVDPVTYTLNPDDVLRRITQKTAAIIAVHLYGHPCKLDALLEICEQHGLKLIEDCAQAHCAEYKGKKVGTFGDVAAFSFYPGKNLGAYGDAGAITTNNSILAKKCRMIANHGRIDKYDHQFEGRNSRLDGLQAAVLSVKLPHLEKWISIRNRVAAFYTEGLADIKELALPTVSPVCRHAFHLYVLRTEQRGELADFLNKKGIQTGVHYPIALPKLAAYAYLNQGGEDMFANKADSSLLSLPIGEHISDNEAQEVVAAVRQFFA